MIIPTKPGTYWFKNDKSGWSLWGVSKEHVCRNGHYYAHHEFQENYDGTFGPIVPGADELTAMEEVIKATECCRNLERNDFSASALQEIGNTLDALHALRKDEK